MATDNGSDFSGTRLNAQGRETLDDLAERTSWSKPFIMDAALDMFAESLKGFKPPTKAEVQAAQLAEALGNAETNGHLTNA